jgi:pyruvate decarboxylase
VDIGPKLIPSSTLQTPLVTSLPNNDQAQESQAVSHIIDLLKSRKDPVIVVDGGKLSTSAPTMTQFSNHISMLGAIRNGVINETKALIEILGIPYFITAMSKGGISERLGKFGGVYGGGASTEDVRTAVESAGLILFIGYYPVYLAPFLPVGLC